MREERGAIIALHFGSVRRPPSRLTRDERREPRLLFVSASRGSRRIFDLTFKVRMGVR
jgi:hypothetical protein